MKKIENKPELLENSIHYANTSSVGETPVEPILGDINQQLRNMSVTIRNRLSPYFSRHYSNTRLFCEYRRRKHNCSLDSLSKLHSRASINGATRNTNLMETTRHSASLSAKTFNTANIEGQRVDNSDIRIVRRNALVVTKSQFGGLICKMSGNNTSSCLYCQNNNKSNNNNVNDNDNANDCSSTTQPSELVQKAHINTDLSARLNNAGDSLNIPNNKSPSVVANTASLKTYDNHATIDMFHHDSATQKKPNSTFTTTIQANINSNNDDDVTTSNTYPNTASDTAFPTSHLVSRKSGYQAGLQDAHDRSSEETSLIDPDNRLYQTKHLDSSNNKSSTAFTAGRRIRRDSSNNAAAERLDWQMQSITDVLDRRTRMRTLVDSLLAWAVIQFVTLLVLFVLATSCRCVFQIAFPCNGGDKCRLRKK